jgi:hypothetical protein
MTTRLHDLRAGLLQLHKLLLDEQREAYEANYGPVASGPALLRLVLHHEEFAWLRMLSAMIATIDAALDEAEGAGLATCSARAGTARSRRSTARRCSARPTSSWPTPRW